MDIESVNSKSNAGVTLGTIGTALSGLQLLNGGLGGLLGGNASGAINAAATVMCGDSAPVSRYELRMAQELAQKDSQIALLQSEQNTEVKIADVYERLATRINADQRAQAEWNASQSVANAQMTAAIATNSASIAGLQNACSQITKLVVPNTSVCPGWGDVTITPAAK